MGVMRDRLGHLEDQFFSTLFFGSGLLYLAMTFASAAITGGILTVYAMRMAGMHMIVLGTIWMRTQIMPR